VAAADTLALYVHWPFCASKCPYCDFNSHVRAEIDEARWRAALLREIDAAADETPGRVLTSVFFGGGTPSLMAPATVAAILERADARWTAADDLEVTIEANPGAAETGRLADFRAAGVNRVSIGVQALDDDVLRFLGRIHDADAARSAIERAAALFPRYSFDLIYARPDQSVAAWRTELTEALALAGEHLSLYQLTIEPGTAFHARAGRGEALAAEDETAAALFEATQEILDAAGLPAYEISNHARPGGECRHNLTYWRYGDYAGVGPGAHGRLTLDAGRFETQRIRAPEAWLAAVEKSGQGETARERLEAADRVAEALLMGLRLTEGVPVGRLEALCGGAALPDRDRIAELVEGGYLADEPGRLRATAAGRQRLNAVIERLAP
jgi:oxygen-independent coproporphyrinogen-3 oxidase